MCLLGGGNGGGECACVCVCGGGIIDICVRVHAITEVFQHVSVLTCSYCVGGFFLCVCFRLFCFAFVYFFLIVSSIS